MDVRAINRMLELRVKDLAGKPPAGTVAERRAALLRSLGLDPMPPRTELNASVTGTIEREGYRIEKVRYESRPGVLVTAHLYLPAAEGKFPLILRPHGHWEHKKAAPVVQASAIGLALAGYACFVVDSPGFSWDDNEGNERRGMGAHDDLFLAMGAPVQGVYAWDLMRGLDYLLSRGDIDAESIGIAGESGGGTAAMLTFAIEDRIKAAAVVCAAASFEINPHLGCLCNHIPGVMAVGDRADILGLRAAGGALFVLAAEDDPEFPIEGHLRTDEKLRKQYRGLRYRFERFWGGHDYNRRMREATLAFFDEHLRNAKPAPYRPEAVPLTDGALNPAPANTVPPNDPSLLVTSAEERSTRTFRDLLTVALAEPYPSPIRADRLVPWRKYGHIADIKPGAILAIHDETVDSPREPGSLALTAHEIDLRLCILLGLSVAELHAQILHAVVPGGPEGWEASGTGVAGDAFTSMIASVRTLVSTPEAPPRMVVAEGPIASLTARFLARFRPGLEVQTSHAWTSWSQVLEAGIPEIAQPGARYLELP